MRKRERSVEPDTKTWSQPAFAGQAGVARRDITPPVGIFSRSWAPATSDVTTGTQRPFTLTALALRTTAGGEPLILLALDAGWWRRVADEWTVRGAVLDALELSEERVILHLSHTHAGPSLDLGDEEQPGGELIGEYLQLLRKTAVSASREALESCAPATLSWATGRCDMAAKRDLPENGRYIVGFNPSAPADDTVLVGSVRDGAGRIRATLVNYACHPTTLAWQNTLASPDFPGAMREVVETVTGAPCLFLQGADGDLAPRWQYVGDTDVADAHGRQLGYAALSALSGMLPAGTQLVHEDTVESGAPLAMWRPKANSPSGEVEATLLDIDVELRPMPTDSELRRRWGHLDERVRTERIRRAELVASVHRKQGLHASHPAWLWRIGDCVLAAHPGEAYAQLQQVLRDRFSPIAIVVLNHGNAPRRGPGWVYIPDADAYPHDTYQVWQTPLAQGSLERITDAVAHGIQELIERYTEEAPA